MMFCFTFELGRVPQPYSFSYNQNFIIEGGRVGNTRKLFDKKNCFILCIFDFFLQILLKNMENEGLKTYPLYTT